MGFVYGYGVEFDNGFGVGGVGGCWDCGVFYLLCVEEIVVFIWCDGGFIGCSVVDYFWVVGDFCVGV